MIRYSNELLTVWLMFNENKIKHTPGEMCFVRLTLELDLLQVLVQLNRVHLKLFYTVLAIVYGSMVKMLQRMVSLFPPCLFL